ncbi:MAG: hypothetical protein PHR82_08695 [Endomicrobiaceae bacterium]|nr:hypothetical protein [Endomicrobiaceae bacterium]
MNKQILNELKNHAPFTFLGTLIGVMLVVFCQNMPYKLSYNLFYILHPTHVFLSALVTASMYKIHECGRINSKYFKFKCNLWKLLLIGYVGSVGIATISDSIIPYIAEVILDMPNRGIHLGFIEKWWLVNPLALAGIAVAYFWPKTRFPHAGHVLLSIWASLFHIIMAIGEPLNLNGYLMVTLFLFLAVWIPCCTSDIVFPLFFVKNK